jgi:hypothetical protein
MSTEPATRGPRIADHDAIAVTDQTSRRAPLPRPEFFIDRSLGRRHLAAALTAYGLVVHTLSEERKAPGGRQAAPQRATGEVSAREPPQPPRGNVLTGHAGAPLGRCRV